MDVLTSKTMNEYLELRKQCLKQHVAMKAKPPDAILLFRNGDFYEAYHEDARDCSAILGLTLIETTGAGKRTKVALVGFPHHALDSYLPKIVRAGHRVAICEQLQDPKKP